jgi:serine/threonine-protein kinase
VLAQCARAVTTPSFTCGDVVTLEPGTEFAEYTILGEIGRGGMGTVYAAQHPRLPRQDALKVLNPDLSGSVDFRQRFIREADIAARLDHPNIVHVYDRGEIDGQLWIATQFIDGIDVARLLHDRYPAGMPVEDALPIIRATAAALDYAHSHGMLHRDVKPANILLSQPRPDGQRQVYLADFGIARPLTDPNGLTATNLTLGTVAYAAPEQLMGAALDPKADQYALACSAFHFLTGAPPYPDPNAVAVIGQHLNAPVPMLSNRRPDLGAMNAVFGKALAKNPRDRFSSCTEFAAALEQVAGTGAVGYGSTQAGMTMAAPAAPHLLTPASPTKRPFSRRVAAISAAALAAVGVLVAAGIQIVDSGDSVAEHRLNGTYKFEYDKSRTLVNGSLIPITGQSFAHGAFRSACSKSGCVAEEVHLDSKDPTIAVTPRGTSWWRFVDGRWIHEREETNGCAVLGVTDPIFSGKTQTQNFFWDLQEQLDGSFVGTHTVTALSGECGLTGRVVSYPYRATRTGDTSPDVAEDVLDLAQAPPPPVPLAPPDSGLPTIDGEYRLEEDFAAAKFFKNGVPQTGWTRTPLAGNANADGGSDSFWAIRSLCAGNRCVATTVKTKEENVPSEVYQLVGGTWQTEPELVVNVCDGDKKKTTIRTRVFELTPQGVLVGTEKEETVRNECDPEEAGLTAVVPLTATRVGDIPPGTVLADPALFLS